MLATKLVTSEDPNAQETSEWLEALDGVVEEGHLLTVTAGQG